MREPRTVAQFQIAQEFVGQTARLILAPLRREYRRSPLYRLLLRGAPSDRFAIQPHDYVARSLEDADALLRGRFRFGNETVEVKAGSVFEQQMPSARFAEALHAFEWLPPLAMAGGRPAQTLAKNLISQWQRRFGKYGEPSWATNVMARRLMNLFCHGRFVVVQSDVLWRSRLFVSLREQSRMLARLMDESPEGIPRFESTVAVVLSGACLEESSHLFEEGMRALERQCGRQILPDGGHISRQPEALLNAYRLTTVAMDAATAVRREIPKGVRDAHDRMGPMLRFFRHDDRRLAVFNGGLSGDARCIDALLARDPIKGLPFRYAPHSGYFRFAGGRTVAIMDCGAPPPIACAADAHAGCLSFELSSSRQRIVVNCGARSEHDADWKDALAATAAHSTVTVADTSSASFLRARIIRRFTGSRLLAGPQSVAVNTTEMAEGSAINASHDGYEPYFGVIHRRQLEFSGDGSRVSGVDEILPVAGKVHARPIPYVIRFHIHPDVRVSVAQSGDMILKLPDSEAWRFRCDCGDVAREDSIYAGDSGGAFRKSEQIVLKGSVRDSLARVAWSLERM